VKRPHIQFLLYLPCLFSAPLMAQTQIGGGTCNSSSLSGVYAMTLTGRQVASSGTFSNILQANGTANFNGQSKITMTLSADTLKGVAAPLTYSGTYSIQANCAGVVNISVGDTAAFNLVVYNQGNAFLVTGSDSTYAYTGGGSNQPGNSCTTAKLSGVYSFNLTGYSLTSGAVSGIEDGVGLAQFDGLNSVTVNATLSVAGGSSSAVALKGTYAVSSTCLGSASLTDSAGNAYVISISVSGASTVAITALDMTLSQASKVLLTGAAHPLYGQPTANAADRQLIKSPTLQLLLERIFGINFAGERV
jgi:hypothetical protein